MLQQLTSKQVAEWQAYSWLEPFGSRHRDWHFGKLASMMVAMFGSKQEFEPADFVKPNRLDYERRLKKEASKQSGGSIKEFFKTLKQMQNGQAEKKQKGKKKNG